MENIKTDTVVMANDKHGISLEKDLNLDTVAIANEKHGIDIDRLIKNSVNNSKIPVFGELYRGKTVKKELIKKVAGYCAFAITAIVAYHEIDYNQVTDKYNQVLNTKIVNELSEEQAQQFLAVNSNKDNRVRYHDYEEAKKLLDDSRYDISNTRVDGTTNEYYEFDGNFFHLSEKQVDAIDDATTNEINSFKENFR